MAMGAVVLVAVGASWAVGDGVKPAPPNQGSASRTSPDQASPDPVERWACEAQVALDSVRRQLDQIDDTRRRWEARFAGEQPPEVRDLLARKHALELQQAVLVSQLRAWRSIPDVRADLAADQERVAALDRTFAANRDGSAEQRTQVEELARQREQWMRHRDGRRRELDRLVQITQRAATGRPLAAASEAITDRLSGAVLILSCGRPR
ncbi:MAG: hypothetical protein J2P19_05840 [Pseudonocardia sp.]|nr:hypothetical protein [Pseudonocardia sp.]